VSYTICIPIQKVPGYIYDPNEQYTGVKVVNYTWSDSLIHITVAVAQ